MVVVKVYYYVFCVAHSDPDVSSPSAQAIWNIWSSSNRFESTTNVGVSMCDSDVSTETIGPTTCLQSEAPDSNEKVKNISENQEAKNLNVNSGTGMYGYQGMSHEMSLWFCFLLGPLDLLPWRVVGRSVCLSVCQHL